MSPVATAPPPTDDDDDGLPPPRGARTARWRLRALSLGIASAALALVVWGLSVGLRERPAPVVGAIIVASTFGMLRRSWRRDPDRAFRLNVYGGISGGVLGEAAGYLLRLHELPIGGAGTLILTALGVGGAIGMFAGMVPLFIRIGVDLGADVLRPSGHGGRTA